MLAMCMTLPVLFLGSVEARNWEHSVRRSIDESMHLTADRLVSEVNALMSARTSAIQSAARAVGALDHWDNGVLQHVAEGARQDSDAFEGFYIADTTGRSLVFAHAGSDLRANVDYSDRQYFKDLKRTQGLVMSPVMMGRASSVPVVAIAGPIFGLDGEWRGLVAGGVRLGVLDGLVRSVGRVVPNHHLLLVDEQNQVLADNQGVYEVLARLDAKDPFRDIPTGLPHDAMDEWGAPQRVLTREVLLPSQVWTIWVMTPISVIDAKTDHASSRVQSLVLLALLVAFAVAWIASSVMDKRVGHIKEIATRIGDGDLSIRLESPPFWMPNEIRSLIRAIHQTLDRVENADLEKRTLVKRLEESHARMEPLAAAWNQIGDAIEFTSETGVVMYTNPAARSLLRDTSTDDTRSDIFAEPTALDSGIWEQLHGGGTWRGILARDSHEEGRSYFAVTVSPLTNDDGALDRIVIIRRDITNQRAQEKAAQNNERLAALGTMAASVGHEINNPLTYIRANIESVMELLAHQRLPDSDEINDCMNDALDGTERVAEIVKRMLTLTRDPINYEAGKTEVAAVVQSALAVTHNTVRHRARIEVDVEDDLWIDIRESSLFQILVNVIQNAAQAIPEGNASDHRVRIAARSVEGPAGTTWVQIDVSDTGPGIAQATINHIFDPFFTTKDVGEGTGLGLAVCKTLIQQANGSIDVTSKLGTGTTFHIRFPDAARDTESPDGPVSSPLLTPPTSSRRLKIMVIEDDAKVGRAIASILAEHEVSVFTRYQDAIVAARTRDFDLVLCDVMMPEFNGVQVWKLFHDQSPDLAKRWLFMSGGVFDPGLRTAIRQTGLPTIEKPIQRHRLFEAIHALTLA